MKVASLALGLALAGCMAGAEVPRVTTLPVGQWPEDLVFDSGSGRPGDVVPWVGGAERDGDQEKLAIEGDLAFDTQAAIEIEKVDAAP